MIKSFLRKLKSDKSGNYKQIKNEHNEQPTYVMPMSSYEQIKNWLTIYLDKNQVPESPDKIIYYYFPHFYALFVYPSNEFPITIYKPDCKCISVKLKPSKKYYIEYDELGLTIYCNIKNKINIKNQGICRIYNSYLNPIFWHTRTDNKNENFKYVAIISQNILPKSFDEFRKIGTLWRDGALILFIKNIKCNYFLSFPY